MAYKYAWQWCLSFFLAGSMVCPGAAEEEASFPFPVSSFTLKNGLQVILSEDYTLPLVSVVLAYNVGSLHEQPGKTGVAYVLENMMFRGSLNIGPMQHLSYVNRAGGETSASTTADITSFFQTVPANQLALVLWLESDRMKSLEIDAAKAERTRQDSLAEIIQRKAAEPYLESSLAFERLLYPDFAHGHSVLGREEDVARLTVEDIRSFYATFYVPNNAVLAIVGNINPAKTRDLVEKYFESVAAGKKLPVFLPPRPAEKREIIQSFQEPQAPSPGFHLGYRIAPPFSRDSYALAVIDYILLQGQTSRLYRKIVKKEGLALYLSGGVETRKDVAVLKMFAMNNNETMVELSQKGIFSEINKLRTSEVSEAELTKAKNMFKRDYYSRFATPLERALALTEIFFSPVSLENAPLELTKYLRVTPFEVRVVTDRYLVPDNSVILNVRSR
ncbi:MAG: pitrilysin family protein [Acidobacteriota bacterium]